MSILRILIADDEPLAVRRLQIIVERRDDLSVVAVARDGAEALARVSETRPDVVLLDVEMPGYDGFAVVEQLPAVDPPIVIFVTAFDHYAARAFEARAIDYLVKPVDSTRLYAALDHAREQLLRKEAHAQVAELRELIANLRRAAAPVQAPRYESEIWVRAMGDVHRVLVDSIDWIQAERDYVRLHTSDRSYLLRDTITALAGRLDPARFVRIHRSTVVSRELVAAIGLSARRSPVVRLTTGQSFAVGRTFVAQLQTLRTGAAEAR